MRSTPLRDAAAEPDRGHLVDAATLPQLYFASTVAWSADSQQLLVKTQPQRSNRCGDLWHVPAAGGKPQLLRRC